MSLDVPPCLPLPNYTSSIEGSLTIGPPSSTLSTHLSVHFATSVAVRDNKLGDGTSSLRLLNTDRSVAKHIHKPSLATSWGHSSLDRMEPDHDITGLSSVSMTVESSTHPYIHTFSECSHLWSHPKKDSADSDGVTAISGMDSVQSWTDGKRRAEVEKEESKHIWLDLEQHSDEVDLTPFTFKLFTLVSMLDSKNLETLETLGAIGDVLKGLGTNRTCSLLQKADGPGRSVSQWHGQEDGGVEPGIIVTPLDVLKRSRKGDDNEKDNNDSSFSSSLKVHWWVYEPNVLTKSLVALMWLALKDKVLVCVFRIYLTCMPF
jgi:P-type Ca2+ transporter type 2C